MNSIEPAPIGMSEISHSFADYSELEAADNLLRSRVSVDSVPGDRSFLNEVRVHVSKVAATGKVLMETKQRLQAQRMLDFWTFELVTHSDGSAMDFVPVSLARFENQELGTSDGGEAGGTAKREISPSHEVIRLSAAARLWRDSGRKKGYLLSGDALVRASKFRDADPDIADFVDACEERALVFRMVVVSAVGASVFSVGVCLAVFEWGLPLISRSAAASITDTRVSSEIKQNGLFRLAQVQPFLPFNKSQFNLSKASLKDVKVPGIAISGLNLTNSELKEVDFRDARLPGGAFHESTIFGGVFEGSDLRLAQFENATLAFGTFAGANLRRASFDDATLCDVDFTGADLLGTTFRNAKFGRNFAEKFSGTAWWLAVWRPEHVRALARANTGIVRRSKAFAILTDELKDQIRQERPGSYGRAGALNAFAWTLAMYGIDLGNANSPSEIPDALQCVASSEVPTDAVSAAAQAVCIARSLGAPAEAASYNYQDTLGYVLLQILPRERAREAASHLKAVEEFAQRQPVRNREVLFRYAVAQYVIGEKDLALANVRETMNTLRYVPTHELQRLKDQMSGEFSSEVYRNLEVSSAEPETADVCRLSEENAGRGVK